MPQSSSRSLGVDNIRLFKKGGFEVFDSFPNTLVCNALLREAVGRLADAHRQDRVDDEVETYRGGLPARHLFTSSGGPVQTAFYNGKELLDFVQAAVGAVLRPTGCQGSYSYYIRHGDHLALHRDIEQCDVTLITCLCDEGGLGEGGYLYLYPERMQEQLSQISNSADQGRVPVHLMPGQTVVLLGGHVPHSVAPVVDGQKRIVSVLCFSWD